MKIKGRKVFAFITTWITLAGLGVLTIFFAPDAWNDASKYIIIGLLVNAFVFISFTVLKDFIKTKFFNENLFNGLKE